MKLINPFKRKKEQKQNNIITVKYSKLDNIGKVKRFEIPDKNEIDNSINEVKNNFTDFNNKLNAINTKLTTLENLVNNIHSIPYSYWPLNLNAKLELLSTNNKYCDYRLVGFYESDYTTPLAKFEKINSLKSNSSYFVVGTFWGFAESTSGLKNYPTNNPVFCWYGQTNSDKEFIGYANITLNQFTGKIIRIYKPNQTQQSINILINLMVLFIPRQ